MPVTIPFRFEASTHEYITLQGDVLPSITQMIRQCGLVNDRFYTATSCERGSCVHRLTTEFDLGALARDDIPSVNSIYKGWLLAHIAAVDIIRPEWLHIEEPLVSAQYRFGGRPDRVARIYGAVAVVEVKSGVPEPAHAVQLALQCLLVAPEVNLPAESIVRYGLYLKGTGRFKFELFPNTRKDFAAARKVIKECT